ncbi:hypothetical protein ABLT35_09965 [Acinetobacter johnsonii]|jgi:hypothetical protein|uniref:hypothetical protein n=1 Tax=Acinetobacter johnsonii TaxID=40214 RepID=UPI0032678A5C
MSMPHVLLSTLTIAMLTACSPSQDTAEKAQTQATEQQDAQTQQFMQSDLTESAEPTPNDQIPLASEVNMDEPVNTENLSEDKVEPDLVANEEFDIKVYRAESQGSMTGYIDKIDVISLNGQLTTITGIQVNRGNCAITRMYDYSNMRYGAVALAYPRCKVEQIREVSISTANGTYAYQFD